MLLSGLNFPKCVCQGGNGHYHQGEPKQQFVPVFPTLVPFLLRTAAWRGSLPLALPEAPQCPAGCQGQGLQRPDTGALLNCWLARPGEKIPTLERTWGSESSPGLLPPSLPSGEECTVSRTLRDWVMPKFLSWAEHRWHIGSFSSVLKVGLEPFVGLAQTSGCV